MLRFLFILPFLMCLGWYLYLRNNGWTLRQGIKGFGYILGFNVIIGIFFTTMHFLTQ